MIMNKVLENYLVYLNVIEKKVNKFFDEQKPYIFCKKGCAKCCQNAEFPFSKIEFCYLMEGASKLPLETKQIISDNITKILTQRKQCTKEEFLYTCPFLINNVCSVYQYRGIVCRTFGLMSIGSDGRVKVPFCCFQGMNYSNVLEDGGTQISREKYQKLGYEKEPVAFNINYNFLTDADFENGFHFKFGEKKPLIEWFIQPDQQSPMPVEFPLTNPNIK